MSVIKHSKPSTQGSHADQNTPANIPTSKPAAMPSRSSSNPRLAPASHIRTDQTTSPAVVLSQTARADLLPATAASGHGVEGFNLLPRVGGSDLPPAAATSFSAMAHCVQEHNISALCAQEDSSRQSFTVIRADSSPPATVSLGEAVDPQPENPPQRAAQLQLPAQPEIQEPQAPLNTLASQHAQAAQRSDGSSVNDQCSSSGSFDRPGICQEVGHVRHMRNPVSSGSSDTAASSSSNAAATTAAALLQSASTQASVKDALSWQPSSTITRSDSVSNGVCNGSPAGSRTTAASTSEGRAGLVCEAPCRESRFSGKPSSRARASAVAAGRQKKSKGASIEVSSW